MESVVLYLLGGVAAIVSIYGLARRKEKRTPVIEEKPSNLKLAIKDLKIARDGIGKNSSVAFIALLIFAIKNYLAAEFKYVDSSKTSDEILAKFVHDVTNDIACQIVLRRTVINVQEDCQPVLPVRHIQMQFAGIRQAEQAKCRRVEIHKRIARTVFSDQ